MELDRSLLIINVHQCVKSVGWSIRHLNNTLTTLIHMEHYIVSDLTLCMSAFITNVFSKFELQMELICLVIILYPYWYFQLHNPDLSLLEIFNYITMGTV